MLTDIQVKNLKLKKKRSIADRDGLSTLYLAYYL